LARLERNAAQLEQIYRSSRSKDSPTCGDAL
jgi:hypothetical protein